MLLLSACSSSGKSDAGGGEKEDAEDFSKSGDSGSIMGKGSSEGGGGAVPCAAWLAAAGDGGSDTFICGGNTQLGCVGVTWCKKGSEYCLIMSEDSPEYGYEVGGTCEALPTQCAGSGCECTAIRQKCVMQGGGGGPTVYQEQ
jgi:hypothetical protein